VVVVVLLEVLVGALVEPQLLVLPEDLMVSEEHQLIAVGVLGRAEELCREVTAPIGLLVLVAVEAEVAMEAVQAELVVHGEVLVVVERLFQEERLLLAQVAHRETQETLTGRELD
jgi:hypothetical protein